MSLLSKLKQALKGTTIAKPQTHDELAAVLDKALPKSVKGNVVEKDTTAVFFGEGTEEEFEELQREDKGLKGVFGL
jgi:hypothetical protein